MSAIETFRFGRYTLRPAGAGVWDHRLAREWTAADRDHAGRVDPEFWTEQSLGRDSWLLIDHSGPLLFFKLIVIQQPTDDQGGTVEAHMQFAPEPEGEEEKKLLELRTIGGLTEGLRWLERVLTQSRIDAIFFDSTSETLVAFSVRKLGFIQTGSRLHKRLTPATL